jgi:hypothetical protein
MQRNIQSDEQASATQSKFYLPAGPTPSSLLAQLQSVWARLFSHRVEISK